MAKDIIGQEVVNGSLIVVTTTGYSHSVGTDLAIVHDAEKASVRRIEKQLGEGKWIDGRYTYVKFDKPRYVLVRPYGLQKKFTRSVVVKIDQIADEELRDFITASIEG